MDKAFNKFFLQVDEVKRNLEEKENLVENQKKIRNSALELFASIVSSYEERESQIIERMELEEKQNQDNRSEIVVLTRQQLKADLSGSTFVELDRLNKLKEDVSTHQLRIEALESLKNEVVVSSDDHQKMLGFRLEWSELNRAIHVIDNKLIELITEIRNSTSLDCLSSVEYIPGRNEFLKNEFEKISRMRTEEI